MATFDVAREVACSTESLRAASYAAHMDFSASVDFEMMVELILAGK